VFGSARSIFYRERGLPAELEIGKREIRGGVVQVTRISTSEKSRTRFVCSTLHPPPPSSQPADKGSHMVSTFPPISPPPPSPHVGTYSTETITLDFQVSL
jgi:hypothetical protein